MDRMKDSGSFDWGSSPHGITTDKHKSSDYSEDFSFSPESSRIENLRSPGTIPIPDQPVTSVQKQVLSLPSPGKASPKAIQWKKNSRERKTFPIILKPKKP